MKDPERVDIEVLPADEPKQLKLGWVVHEVIGQAIVNPRAMGKAIPRHIFGDERGSIEIRRYSIEITGRYEIAAKAMAEEMLNRKPTSLDYREVAQLPEDNYYTWDYMQVIQVVRRNGHFTIDLTKNGLGLIDPEVWAPFKKSVEKICNDLKAFL